MAGTVVVGLNGFVPPLTSFVGRAGQVDEVAGLLGGHRLVTVTGPGGVGKTRLAGEVARRVAGRFADGVWLVELAAVQEPALVPAAVAVALGIPQPPGMSIADALAGVLARRQLLLVMDNCEHVAAAVAQLCGAVLPAADEVRVLATSREPLGIGGEARYRLPPLALPGPDDLGEMGASEAVALFADRARQADAHFALGGEAGPAVAQLVARLDGMPLAIELAAARVESLGVVQLLDRLDDRFALLAGGDRLAAPRQRSLAATVEWSYQLLSEDQRRVFRRLAVFPGPFTLEAAETVAGAAAGPAVLHLVDCSLLTPPRPGPDGWARYLMLETLRAYGLDRLAQAGEQHDAAIALAGHALQVAEQAAAGLETSAGELAAARWLDAEDATVHQSLAWALEHDATIALRLAVALASWWQLRGRPAEGHQLLSAAARHAAPGSEAWCAAQLWLGRTAANTGDMVAALDHFTRVVDVTGVGPPSPPLADALVGRSIALHSLGHQAEAARAGRHGLAAARESGYPAGEVMALRVLGLLARAAGDAGSALDWARQAGQVDPSSIPGWIARMNSYTLTWFLIEAGDLAAAQDSCGHGLAGAREAGDQPAEVICLSMMADLDLRADRLADAGVRLREALTLAARIGDRETMLDCLDYCGRLCAATQRWAEAVTLWTAYLALWGQDPALAADRPEDEHARQDRLREAARILGPARIQAAERRGASLSLATAAELAIMLTDSELQTPDAPEAHPGVPKLSAREQELVTLVARGHTDAQIAGQLYISVSTVRSHLDRIRDKSGCRRRADLTRLALQAGLV